MPWYKFHAVHGPGHQSTTDEHRFFNEPIESDGALGDAWHDWAGREQFDNAIGGCTLATEMTANEINIETLRCQGKIALNQLAIIALQTIKIKE